MGSLQPAGLAHDTLLGAKVCAALVFLGVAAVGAACAVTLIGATKLMLLVVGAVVAGALAGAAIRVGALLWSVLSRLSPPSRDP